jgi:23S rRNA pseudouridine2605 synthase
VKVSVPLGRALSKLGILSRSLATNAIRDGRVRVNGRISRDPAHPVVPERVQIEVDGIPHAREAWRTILFHKPRGAVTTRRDPEGRETVFDVLGDAARGLVAVGRLDRASSGLLLLTTDTQLANLITDPRSSIPKVYIVSVRGRVREEACARLTEGLKIGGEQLRATAVRLRKASGRESHLTVELREGKNREIRRLFEALGHEVTSLKRVSIGPLQLGNLAPGKWRQVSATEIKKAFPYLPCLPRQPRQP